MTEIPMRRTRRMAGGSGLVGVVIFSGSLPATRVAVGRLPAAVPDLGPGRHRGAAGGGAARRLAANGNGRSRGDLGPLWGSWRSAS